MSAAAKLLDRLTGVRECGDRAWMGLCPSHPDNRPSLSVRELDDGTLLVHCFAGCDTGDILQSIGLRLHDLFPVKLKDRLPPQIRRAHYHALAEALRSLRHDALVVALAASDVAAGRTLSDDDLRKLFAAAARARRAAEISI